MYKMMMKQRQEN